MSAVFQHIMARHRYEVLDTIKCTEINRHERRSRTTSIHVACVHVTHSRGIDTASERCTNWCPAAQCRLLV